MMGGPPPAPGGDVATELTQIKAMLQALIDAQIAMMQAMMGPQGEEPMQDPNAAGGPPMDPSMMGGPPPQGMDPSMMGGPPPQGMDPSMMGGPPPQGMPPMDPNAGGMQVQASYEEVSDLNRYIRDIASLLR